MGESVFLFKQKEDHLHRYSKGERGEKWGDSGVSEGVGLEHSQT